MGWKWLWDKRHRSWAFLTADPYLMFARPPCIFVCSFTGGWINEGGKACVTHTRRLQVLQYHQLGVQRWKQHAKNSHECLINRFYTTESDNSFDRKLSCLLAQSAYVFCSGVLLRELRPLDQKFVCKVDQDAARKRERLHACDRLDVDHLDALDAGEHQQPPRSANRNASSWTIAEDESRPSSEDEEERVEEGEQRCPQRAEI
mmetsp:Transcript_27510/g.60357  ORF Transcript_27510/g.60357 Transcript_27510/m.60357 type:complete len:203 (+) Transcript_27510:81-689(+)